MIIEYFWGFPLKVEASTLGDLFGLLMMTINYILSLVGLYAIIKKLMEVSKE